MILQERDRSLLQVCSEHQFLMFEHVEHFFFPDASARRARERLLELERAGLIRREKPISVADRTVIRVTPEGQRLVAPQTRKNVQIRKLDLSTLEHDAHVASLRLRLAQLWMGSGSLSVR